MCTLIIGYVLQYVRNGMEHYLHMERVGFENAKLSSLGLRRPFYEVPIFMIDF